MGTIHEKRRLEFIKNMKSGIAIIPATPERVFSHDLVYPYRPSSYLNYLTNYKEPSAVAIFRPNHEHSFIMFVRERDAEAETWYGTRGGTDGAIKEFGAHQAYPITDLEAMLPELLANQEQLYYRLNHSEYDRIVLQAIETLRSKVRLGQYPPRTLIDPGLLLDEMRLTKTEEADITALKKANQITSIAHCETRDAIKSGENERLLEGVMFQAIVKHGGQWPSFNTIVASGKNACILHYDENNCPLEDGNLVLIDAGAEVDGWCGDITRTYPISGTFTKPQAEIYDIVLQAQKVAIEACSPGTTLDAIMDKSVQIICQGLSDLGFFNKKSVDEVIKNLEYKQYFMHRVSHWIGMDTHDVGDYHINGKPRELVPGMAFSIEPGIYINPGSDCPSQYHGIGIRIEDVVLLTQNGYELITDVPKERTDIEALMKKI